MPDSTADRLARALGSAGTDTAFGVPGGGPNLEVIAALEAEGIRFVLGHGETATCIMASTYGHIGGRVAPVVVTRGPGAASAVNGAAQATLDRQPLILITDTVPANTRNRVVHQRLDQRAMLEPVTVASLTLGDQTTDEDLASVIGAASQWPAGAIHIDYDSTESGTQRLRPKTDQQTQGLAPVLEAVGKSRRPVILLGTGALASSQQLGPVLRRFGAPVFSTYQATGIVGTEEGLFAGLFTNGFSERPLIEAADLIIAIGLDAVEPIPAPWNYSAPVISLASTPTNDDYLPITHEAVGDIGELATAIMRGSHTWETDAGALHNNEVRARLHSETLELGPVDLVKAVASCTPANLTVTVDAGAHFLAVMPFWPVSEPNRLLISNGLATMGYSVPAAIGAALARPGEPVLCFVGDGGLGMTLAELETITRLDLPITVVVFNDATLSLIGIKQKAGQGGPGAVGYSPIDFSLIAEAMGMEGWVVNTTAEVVGALGQNWMRPRLIDARIDPSPYRHLIRVTRGG